MCRCNSIFVLVSGLLIFLLPIIAISPLPVWAQEVSAGITGRVTDPAAAAVPAAKVTARDLDRGIVWPTDTNAEGIYAFPRLQAGVYEIRIEAPGFRTAVQTGVRLELN